MKSYFKFLLSALILGFMVMCKHEPTSIIPVNQNTPIVDTTTTVVDDTSCDPDSVYFNNQILPIFLTSCAQPGCHTEAAAQSGVVLTDYNNIIREIVPNNLDESDIYEVITETDPNRLMPFGGPALDQSKIDLIATWIQQGAPNNNCEACDTSTVSFQNDIFPLIQSNCQATGCHGAVASLPAFDSYQNIKDNTQIIQQRAVIQKNMPPAGPLPNCDMSKLDKWIRDGAQNN